MKVYEIKKLIDKWGHNTTLGQLLEDLDRPYKCPKCEGKGGVNQEYNSYPRGLPDSDWAYQAAFRWIPCSLCEEHGYTKTLKKPIVKTEIVGYE